MTQTDTFPPAVAAVRQQFEDWRAAQTRRRSLPKELWQAAAALLPRFPLALVARACRLNARQLKQHAHGSARPTPAPTTFRTVTPVALQQAAGLSARPAAEVRFALTRRDGTQLQITCPADSVLAAALCQQWLATSKK